jgi:hypothetical protein
VGVEKGLLGRRVRWGVNTAGEEFLASVGS